VSAPLPPPVAAPRGVPPAAASPPGPPAAVPYRVSSDHTRLYTVQDAPRSSDLGASLRRAWEFLRQSLLLAREHTVLLAPSLLSALSGLVLVGVYVALTYFLRGGFEATRDPVQELALRYIGVALAFFAALMNFWFMGMTAYLVSAALRGQPLSLGQACGEAVRNAWALFWLAVVTAVVSSLAGAVRKRAPMLGDLAADAIQKGWQVATYLLVPIIILEDIPLSGAFNRALRLHHGNVVGIIVGEVGISALSGIISFVILGLGLAGAALLYHGLPLLLPLLIAGFVALMVIVMAGVGYVRMAYYTCLYEWAAALETATEPVPAPAPLAAALQSA